MSQADSISTALFKPPGESLNELTHAREIIKESGIPVADSLKDEMFAEMALLTQKEADTVYGDDRRLSA